MPVDTDIDQRVIPPARPMPYRIGTVDGERVTGDVTRRHSSGRTRSGSATLARVCAVAHIKY